MAEVEGHDCEFPRLSNRRDRDIGEARMVPIGLGGIAEHAGNSCGGEIKWQDTVGIHAEHAVEPVAQFVRPPSGADSAQFRDARLNLGGRGRRREELVGALFKPIDESWRNSPLAGGKGAQNVGIEQPSGQKSDSRKGDGSRSISTA
jgi:hypothetical protein